jgi:serine/threonine protein kinase
MEAPGVVPPSINCHACGAIIDLTARKGFTRVECSHCGAPSIVPVQFGNFELLNRLGVGGMGTVYKAIDLSLNRHVALKILNKKLGADPEFKEKFSTEAQAAAAVNHPNIAQVYGFDEIEGQYYLAIELLEHGSLDDRITQLGKLPEQNVLEIASKVAAGLRTASQRGLLHRDIKPGNILFSADDEPKIVDFGLARIHGPAAEPATAAPQPTPLTQIWGTPYYIAPEKLRGQPEDFRSDIYSLGATLFHALAGRPPFEAATATEVVTKHATQPALSLKTFAPATHEYTAHVIARMLAKNPAERYESYDDLIRDLNEALTQVRAAESAKAIVAPTGERFSIGSILGTAAAVIVCAVVAWVVWSKVLRPSGSEQSAGPAGRLNAAAGSVTTNSNPAESVDDVDFAEDADWVKAWNSATLQMTLGRYTEALLMYDNARLLLGPDRPKHRQWVSYFQALTLLAADRGRESTNVLLRAVDPLVGTKIPEKIGTGNFSTPLAQALLGTVTVAELEAAMPRMPAWATALAHFSLGLKFRDEGKFDKAAEAFHRYQSMPVDEKQRWAYTMQSLAEKFAGECAAAARTLAEIDALQQQNKFASALEKVQAASAAAASGALKTVLLARETDLQRLLDRQRDVIEDAAQRAELERREQLERQLEQLDRERKLLHATETEVGALWQLYDFKRGLARYEQLSGKIESDEARHTLQQKLAMAKLLAEFKSELAADFARRAYERGDLQTRAAVQLSGKLARATDDQLVFSTPYGEILTPWVELTPATLIKLAEHYITLSAATTRGEALGRRHLRLAVFCKQFGAERAATTYAKRAVEIAPSLRAEMELAFGKTPG